MGTMANHAYASHRAKHSAHSEVLNGNQFFFYHVSNTLWGLKKIKTIDEGVSPHNNSGHAKNTKLISLVADLHKGVLPPIPSSLASAAKPRATG